MYLSSQRKLFKRYSHLSDTLKSTKTRITPNKIDLFLGGGGGGEVVFRGVFPAHFNMGTFRYLCTFAYLTL